MRKPNIIVCGDILLDCNVYLSIQKIANEAPILVFNQDNEEYKLGGCGNVLQNLHSLGCESLYMFGAIGNDIFGKKVLDLVQSMNVHNHIRVIDANTLVKRRNFCDNKILFRSDIEVGKECFSNISFAAEIEHILQTKQIDCIVLSDYNKGILTFAQCQSILQLAKKYNVFTCVDPKDDYRKYVGCSLIKPNKSEAYKLFNLDKSVCLNDVHTTIYSTINCTYSVVTMSEHGISLYDGKELIHELPDEIHKIIDVTGAGDIVCSILGYFICLNAPLRSVLRLATQIATKSVECPGTYCTSMPDVIRVAFKGVKVIPFHDIPKIRQIHVDKTVVCTNGCFDLLHSGHIETFKFCKSKGDIVVVALNSDASIRRLKGELRPINTLQIRLDVLSAIQYIDYVIVFEEDTPTRIMERLKPDILVKGGDYTIDTIPGREFAKETLVCPLVPGMSSTAIIERVKDS